jgi:hypothetical protein
VSHPFLTGERQCADVTRRVTIVRAGINSRSAPQRHKRPTYCLQLVARKIQLRIQTATTPAVIKKVMAVIRKRIGQVSNSQIAGALARMDQIFAACNEPKKAGIEFAQKRLMTASAGLKPMTRKEEIEKRMDDLAREYRETGDEKIFDELHELARELQKLKFRRLND